MERLQYNYLFPEIAARELEHVTKYPNAEVISLEIGDTTEPLPEVMASSMANIVRNGNTLWDEIHVEYDDLDLVLG